MTGSQIEIERPHLARVEAAAVLAAAAPPARVHADLELGRARAVKSRVPCGSVFQCHVSLSVT